MPRITDWTLRGADSQLIYGNTHHPPGGGDPRGVALLLHGFKGYKDYGLFPQLAEALADAGLIAHRFNFSHSGMTNRIETFGRPDLFERDTWGKQQQDVAAVLDGIDDKRITGGGGGGGRPVVLFGHSRGGLTALLAAASHRDRLAGVISAAAPADPVRLSHEQREQIRKQRRLLSPSGRTGQDLYVGLPWLEEVEADPDRFNPRRAIGELSIPVLLLHASDDDTVPVDDAKRLYDASDGHAELTVFDGGNHVFNAPNPLPLEDDPPPLTTKFMERVVAFAGDCCG